MNFETEKEREERFDRDKEQLLAQVKLLKKQHFFILVEEAHGYVEGTTKFPETAVEWYLNSVKSQSRWFNPAVYVCNCRCRDRGESSVSKKAVPILSSYSYLQSRITELREMYLKLFPNEKIEKARQDSW